MIRRLAVSAAMAIAASAGAGAQMLDDYWAPDFGLPGLAFIPTQGTIDSANRPLFLYSDHGETTVRARWDGEAWLIDATDQTRAVEALPGTSITVDPNSIVLRDGIVFGVGVAENGRDRYILRLDDDIWKPLYGGPGTSVSVWKQGADLYATFQRTSNAYDVRSILLRLSGSGLDTLGSPREGRSTILGATPGGAVLVRRMVDAGQQTLLEWWDGSEWHSYSGGPSARALNFAVAYNGELYGVGTFERRLGSDVVTYPVARLALNGWEPVGDTMASDLYPGALSFDRNGSPVLAVRRRFAPENEGSTLLRWNGSSWRTAIPGRFDGSVHGILHSGDGSVYVYGSFTTIDDTLIVRHVARHDGTRWSAVGGDGDKMNGIIGTANAVQATRGLVYVGGEDLATSGVDSRHPLLLLRDGTWSAIPGLTGLPGGEFLQRRAIVESIVEHPEKGIVVSGTFEIGNSPGMRYVAWWDGTIWRPMDDPHLTWMSPPVIASADGEIVAAGSGIVYIKNEPRYSDKVVARWSGQDWDVLSFKIPISSVAAIAPWKGTVVIAGTAFDGSQNILSYAHGEFASLGGGTHYRRPLDPVYYPSGLRVSALVNDGSSLLVGGSFDSVAGTAALQMARWDGRTWSSLDSGLSGTTAALADPEVGVIAASRNHVVAAGNFEGGGSRFLDSPEHVRLSSGVAFWDRKKGWWNRLGSGLSATDAKPVVRDMSLADDTLWIVGDFTHAGGKSSVGIARFVIPPGRIEPPIVSYVVDFGYVPLGDTAYRTLAIANPATSTRTTTIRLAGESAPFSYLRSSSGRIAAGDSLMLPLAFYPSDIGNFVDTIELMYGAVGQQPIRVLLRGMSAIAVTGIADHADDDTSLAISCSPNPSAGAVRISFALPSAGIARASIHTLDGREIAVPFEADAAAGSHSIEWDADAAGILSGVYVCRIASGGKQSTTRLILVR